MGSAWGSGSAIGGHDEGRNPSLLADVFGENLVERDGVFVVGAVLGIGSGEELVGIGVTVHVSPRGVRHAGDDGEVFAQGFQWIEALGEDEIGTTAVGEPLHPIGTGGVFGERHGHSVRKKEGGKALVIFCFRALGSAGLGGALNFGGEPGDGLFRVGGIGDGVLLDLRGKKACDEKAPELSLNEVELSDLVHFERSFLELHENLNREAIFALV